MTYKEKRKIACRELFRNFHPDFSGARTNKDKMPKILEMAADGYFAKEIGLVVGMSEKAVHKMYRRYNFPILYNFCPPRREERIGWTGGIKIVKGYAYSRTPGHPNASKYGNYVAVHRLVMEEKLDRYLLTTEVVDHIDGDPSNNHPDNLRVFASNAEHLAATLKDKIPEWSEDGKKSLDRARRIPRRTWKGVDIQPIHAESETDVDQ